ncbi:DEAH (Asp-Glu-Ala-His) box polypeptide 34 [Nowakowskiella sp. JEL0407]|nr:DEAH (Asp-Glu-Ala-His) box polypeptide 34 [Nowakowskiella sp. JEL0407]
MKPKCKYWDKCYQTSDEHLKTYSHPQIKTPAKPDCPYGKDCYRQKNWTHTLEFNHPKQDDKNIANIDDSLDKNVEPKLANKGKYVEIKNDEIERKRKAEEEVLNEVEDDGDETENDEESDVPDTESTPNEKDEQNDNNEDEEDGDEDELACIDGIKPLVLMKDGEEREVESSTSSSKYKIKRTFDHYYCTCIAWKMQSRNPINARSCKHLKETLGEDYELARLKLKNPHGDNGSAKSSGSGSKKVKVDSSSSVGKQQAPKVLLAESYSLDTDPTGYWMSEKLDGVRAIWDPKLKTFLSRTGNSFFAPPSFTENYPTDMSLDGELFTGRGQFNSTVSIVRTMNSPSWSKVIYKVFDSPSTAGTFEERIEKLKKWKKANDVKSVELVHHQLVKSANHVAEELKRIEGLGGEGLMLRKPKSQYEGKRSKTLLKVKSFYDAEAVVEGYEDGKGKHAGVVGALKCRMESGKKFKIGTGLSDKERASPPKIGDIVTYRFQELTPDGIPRFPSYVDEYLFGPPKNASESRNPSTSENSGIAFFKRNSALHDQFKGTYARQKKFANLILKKIIAEFYLKYKQKITQDPTSPRFNEKTGLKNAVLLFKDFNEKKAAALKISIEKARSELPVKQYQQEICDAVRNHPCVLIAADTGAGKSTQVPQYLLQAGFDKIACTQPRRIACFSLAKRVGYETMDEYGSQIAYKVRFDGTKTSETKILFLTEGVLIRQFANDRTLSAYNVIIVDEVHERNVTADFLLGILKQVLKIRKDLRVVLMSATINAELFAKYFNAPIVEIPGRMFPVSIEYHPFTSEEDKNLIQRKPGEDSIPSRADSIKPGNLKTYFSCNKTNASEDPYLRLLERIDSTIPSHERGDVLVFLPGLKEINAILEILREYASYTKKWIILPLHSTLSISDQEKVFHVPPTGIRKCILSTNIAETSVTIDGIRFIIDSGKVKQMAYDPSRKMTKLSEFWIASSSAKQRAGRAGRTGPGVCFRLYTANEFASLPPFPVPEILRTQIHPLALQIIALQLGNPLEFEFLERPSDNALKDSLTVLRDLGAVVGSEANNVEDELRVTRLGGMLALLPVDAVMAKMLVLASISDLIYPAIVIAASLSVQNPFTRVSDSNRAVFEMRKEFMSDEGDPFTLLNIFSEWLHIKSDEKQFEQVLNQYVIRSGYDSDDELDDTEGDPSVKRKRENKDEDDDPDYYQKRLQKRMLERQKRSQKESKKKYLKLEDGEEDEGQDGFDQPMEPTIAELEFNLKHSSTEILRQSTSFAMLRKRDINVLKLIICSGLYPNLAFSDEANFSRRATEQVFHTKNKRFVTMHPTSVFSYKPELLHGQQKLTTKTGESDQGKEETLESIQEQRPKSSELLTFVELVETNKPYLTNVLRVPALPVCLLFARSFDGWLHLQFLESTDPASILALGNFLRCGWDLMVDRKLRGISHHFVTSSNTQKNELEPEAVETPLFGTALATPEMGKVEIDVKSPKVSGAKDKKINWEDYLWGGIEFIPDSIKKMRVDWIDAFARNGKGDFSDLTAEDIFDQLDNFLEHSGQCLVERLRVLDIPALFGYDAYNKRNSKAGLQVTTNIRYFVEDPTQISLLSRSNRKKLQLPQINVWDDEFEDDDKRKEDATTKKHDWTEQEKPLQTVENGSNKIHTICEKCGNTYIQSAIEKLKHNRTCAKGDA